MMKNQTAAAPVFPSPACNFAAFRNPFKLARLCDELAAVRKVENLSRTDWSEGPRLISGKLSGLSENCARLAFGLAAEIETESAKRQAVRSYGMKTGGRDDAWKIWAVLTREASALILAQAERDGAEDEGAGENEWDVSPLAELGAELWAEWGFSAAASELSEYSPTGRMFQQSLSVRVRFGRVILSQYGARDV